MATHTITTGTTTFNGVTQGVNPGDIIEIQSGSRGHLDLEDITGSAANPVYIVNDGGRVLIDAASNWTGIYMTNCHYFILSGRGHGAQYGIKVWDFTNAGLFCEDQVDNCVIEGLEIAEPDPADAGNSSVYWCTTIAQANPYTQDDVEIRYCYFHDSYWSGIYYGNYASSWQAFDGVEIHHCIIESAGNESIQFKNGDNADVHHNFIIDGGDHSGQAEGQSGAGIANVSASGDTAANHTYHHNVIINCARGIETQNHDTGWSIYRNHIISPRVVDVWGGEGIVVWTSSQSILVYENTVKDYETTGIETASGDTGTGSERLDSNICCSDQGGVTHIDSSYGNETNNAEGSVSSMYFQGDYHDTITTSSAAYQAGVGGIHCGWKQAMW